MNFKDPESLLAKFVDVWSTYDLTIEYRQGEFLGIVLLLSLAPCKQCNTDHVDIYIAETGDDVFLSILLKCMKIKDNGIGTFKELLIHNTNLIEIRSLLRWVMSFNSD